MILLLFTIFFIIAIFGYFYIKSYYMRSVYVNQQVKSRVINNQQCLARQEADLLESQQVIHSVKTRRESQISFPSRRNSEDDPVNDWEKLGNGKIARAVSCDWASSDEELAEEGLAEEGLAEEGLAEEGQANEAMSGHLHAATSPSGTSQKLMSGVTAMRKASLAGHWTDASSGWQSSSTKQSMNANQRSVSLDMQNKPEQMQLLVSMAYMQNSERLSVMICKLRIPCALLHNRSESLAFLAQAQSAASQAQSAASQAHSASPQAHSAAPQADPIKRSKMIYVKAYLIDDTAGKRMLKKKTSVQPLNSSVAPTGDWPPGTVLLLVFNELMVFRLPFASLSRTSVQLTVMGMTVRCAGAREKGSPVTLGSVRIGACSQNHSELLHYRSLACNMRKSVSMWHCVRTPQSGRTELQRFDQQSVGRRSAGRRSAGWQSPVHQSPVHQSPVHQSPVHQSPVQQSPVQQSAGQQLIDQQLVGQQLVGQQPSGQHLANQQSVSQQLVGQQSANQHLLGQQSVSQQLVGQQSANQLLLGQQSVSQQLVGQQSANQLLLGQQSVSQQLVGQQSANQQLANQHLANQQLANQHLANQQVSRQLVGQHSVGQHSASQYLAQHMARHSLPSSQRPGC